MIEFNIAGAFTHKLHVKLLKYKNNNDLKFTVYDGVNNCKWNGGRINRNIFITQKDIEIYNKLGISVCFTFTNDVININDNVGLNLLEMLNNSQLKYNIQNEIVLVNNDLFNFLRLNYKFRLKFSITGHQKINNDKYYYKQLEDKYDIIVPKMEDISKNIFIDKSKYELMLNDTCIPNCQYYNEHFLKINSINRLDNMNYFNFSQSKDIEECWIKNFDPNIPQTNSKYGMDFTFKMFSNALEQGFNKFKISGRENSIEDIINDLKKYIKD